MTMFWHYPQTQSATTAAEVKLKAVWPPGSANTVCPHPSVTLTFDRLTLKLVCESHLRWGPLFQISAFRFSNYSLCMRRTDRQTDRQIFFLIQFWYLRCCGCPWNRGRQHLATPLKTCHNPEAGFLQGGCWLLCLSPNSEVTASETPPFPHLGSVPAVVPAKRGSSA